MKDHGFNGTFTYKSEYNATEQDYEVAKELFGGLGATVAHISPMVDINYGNERAVLFSVARRDSKDDLRGEMPNEEMVVLIEESGRKLYHVPENPVPESVSEFEESFKNWTAFGEKVQKRSNLWDAVHRLANMREDEANYVVDSENPLIEIVDEREVGDGMIEWEVEYGEELETLVAEHYDVDTEDVGKQMISDFIVVALQRETAKYDV